MASSQVCRGAVASHSYYLVNFDFVIRCKPSINGDDHAISYGTAEANGLSYIITTVVDGPVLIDGIPSTTTMVSH